MASFTRLAAIAVILGAGLACTFSVRWSYADWLSTRPALRDRRRAAKLAPTDATVWLRLADLLSIDGGDERPALKSALLCSPSDASIWIRLGLESEAYHEYGEAERCLLRATQLDHDLIPVWTLTNFYFRRADPARFFPAARGTLAFSQNDLAPVFRMAWALTPDANRMLTDGMPDAPRPLAAYLNWLLSADLLDAADPVSRNLLTRFPHEGRDALLSYCDRLIASGRWERAVGLWNDMDARKLVVTGPVRGDAILNASFRPASLNRGFDWHVISTNGIEAKPDSPSLWIRFTGTQADSSEIASQLLFLRPGSTHTLRYRTERSGVEAGLGLHWAISDLRNAVIVTQSENLSDAAMNSGMWSFHLPGGGLNPPVEPLRLLLVYDRPPAAPRVDGWVMIESVSLDSLQ